MKYTVDFTNVKDDFAPISEGVHVVIVSGVEQKPGKQYPYLNWEGTVQDGNDKGKKQWWITSLAPEALFNLRNMMIAMGIQVPKSKFDIDTDLMLKRPLGIRVEQYLYEGKTKSKVTEFMPAKDAIDLIKSGYNQMIAPRVLTEEKKAPTAATSSKPAAPSEPIDLGDGDDAPPFKADQSPATQAPATNSDIDLEGIDI